jgi:hypothetical protein
MGRSSYPEDIPWHDYRDHEHVPKYEPPRTLDRTYSPELLSILTAMLQVKVNARPTPLELMDVLNEHMPRYTQGMERWGTREWFEELDGGDVDASVEESVVSEATPLRGGKPKQNITDGLADKLKYLLCIPSARPKHRRTPISRDLSPTSAAKARARAASRKRRQEMVERQIKEGLRPKLQRYVSPDAADDIFALEDDLKIMHPQRGEWTIVDFFNAPDPVPTTYREDIDDVGKFYTAKKAFEEDEEDWKTWPLVGVKEYDFRKDGVEAGEFVYPPKPPPHRVSV